MKYKKILGSIIFISSILVISHAYAEFSEGYESGANMPLGSIVSAVQNEDDQVALANKENADNLLGVVVDQNDSSVHFINSENENEVAVASNGEVYVLVSNINGYISSGDRIAPSGIEGVGEKAVGLGRVIGVARGEFSEEDVQQTVEVVLENETRDVGIGVVRANINIHDYIPSQEDKNFFSSIQNTAQTIAGKPVTVAKALIVLGIMIATLMVVIVVLGGSIQGSMVSLGRNPLAKKTIISSMVKIILFAVAVLTAGSSVAYLILIS